LRAKPSAAALGDKHEGRFGVLPLSALSSRQLQNVSSDENNASFDHPESPRGTRTKVEHATPTERASIVYCNDDTSASLRIGNANAGPELQTAMCRSETGTATGVIGR